MFDIGSSELMLTAIVAIIVIGAKDLPRSFYKFGQMVGKAKDMARHLRNGLDAMVREAELEELEKKWSAEHERTMNHWPSAETDAEPAKSSCPSQETHATIQDAVVLRGDDPLAQDALVTCQQREKQDSSTERH